MTTHDVQAPDAAGGSELRTLAGRYGLTPIGLQPALFAYVAATWKRRHFVYEFARARVRIENAESKLGQLWQVLNPLLNAAVYYIIFGVVFAGKRTIPDFVAFLITGVFIYAYTQRTILSGARSITGNLGMVRALHFPRAILPLGEVLEELLKLGTSLVVLAIIVVATGQPITFKWLLVAPALVLQTAFCAGVAMFFARMTSQVKDVAQFLPYWLRVLMYFSTVMIALNYLLEKAKGYPVIEFALIINPARVYISLVRQALLPDVPLEFYGTSYDWYLAVGWAVVSIAAGFVFFWRAEARYGRG